MNKLKSIIDNYPFIPDAIGLAISIFSIHLIYVLVIDPAVIDIEAASQMAGTVAERTMPIILKDLEQELCLILGLWCLFLLAARYRFSDSDQLLIDIDFTGRQEVDLSIETIRLKLEEAGESVQGSTLIPALKTSLDTFIVTESLDSARNAGLDYCNLREEVIESRLTTVKYILWAIPSIGFLGTVRGIGEALARADEAMQGDISGVASSLGVAFNSTFTALFVSLFLTLVANSLRGREQEKIVKCKDFLSGDFMIQLKSIELDGASKKAVS